MNRTTTQTSVRAGWTINSGKLHRRLQRLLAQLGKRGPR